MPATPQQSVAQRLATQINETLGTAVTPCLVQVLMVFSKPLRQQLRDFLLLMKTQLEVQKTEALSNLTSLNYVSQYLNSLYGALQQILEPVDKFMRAFAVDSIVSQCPEAVRLLQDMTTSIPVSIPSTAATNFLGVGGFDFFEGVHSYQDLRDKLDDLASRASRATAVYDQLVTANTVIDSKIDTLDAYIEVIDTLS